MLIYHLDGTYEHAESVMPVFRKMTNSQVELSIAKTLLNAHNPNIVTIYNVTAKYYDMELLETNYTINSTIINKMHNVKSFLQSLNIAYIDWKPDNIGLAKNGEPMLFDFDGCGIFTPNDTWATPPFCGYAFKKVSQIETNPKKIDDLCFHKYLLQTTYGCLV